MNWNLSGVGQGQNLTYNPVPSVNIGVSRKGRPIIQARSSEKGKYVCSECEITYRGPELVKPVCPLCEQKKITQQVRDALFQATNANNMLTNELESLKVQVDQLAAMKAAFDTTSVEDLTFIKSVVYRWQADRKAVALKPQHGRAKGKRSRPPINGFVAVFRNSDAEVHLCNSVGGLALASYLEEAIDLHGPISAMQTFVRAALQHLEARVE